MGRTALCATTNDHNDDNNNDHDDDNDHDSPVDFYFNDVDNVDNVDKLDNHVDDIDKLDLNYVNNHIDNDDDSVRHRLG